MSWQQQLADSGKSGESGEWSPYVDDHQLSTDSYAAAAINRAEEIQKAAETQGRVERLQRFASLPKPNITPEQFVWLETMSKTGELPAVRISDITSEKYETYYLIKETGKPLQGGFLFNVEKTTSNHSGQPGTSTETRYKISFFNPETKQEISISTNGSVFELTTTLPTSAPRSAIFRRLIDVDDITGEMIFYNDGNGNYTFLPKDLYTGGWNHLCIVEVDPKTTNHVVLDEKSLYDRNTLKSFTGKVITPSLVEKMCGKPGSSEGKKEIYVKCDLRRYTPLKIAEKKPMTDGDIAALKMAIDLSKDAMETQGSKLCVTRSKPNDQVLGPASIELVPIPDGFPQNNTFGVYYIKIGEFSVKININRGEKPDSNGNFKIHSRIDVNSAMLYRRADIFITKSQLVQLDKANTTLHRNLRRRTDPNPAKVGDVVYFYKSTDTTREYPLTGSVVNVVITEDVKKNMFTKNTITKTYKYDIKYTDEEIGEHNELGVPQLYERATEAEKADSTSGGKKNRRSVRRKQRKTNRRKKTRRGGVSSIHKSIKRKMRTKKSRRH